MKNTISDEKLQKYFDVTQRALNKVKLVKDVAIHAEDSGKDFFDMAQRYVHDAEHFAQTGDIVTAFAALNYAHGWLDAGARIGLFDVDHDSELFTVD